MITREKVLELFTKEKSHLFGIIRMDDDIFRCRDIGEGEVRRKLKRAYFMRSEVFYVRNVLERLTHPKLLELEHMIGFYICDMLEQANLFNEKDFSTIWSDCSLLFNAINRSHEKIREEIKELGIGYDIEILYFILFWRKVEQLFLIEDNDVDSAFVLFRDAMENYRRYFLTQTFFKLMDNTNKHTPKLIEATANLMKYHDEKGRQEVHALYKKQKIEAGKASREKEYGAIKRFVLDMYSERKYTSMRQAAKEIEKKYKEWIKTQSEIKPLSRTNSFETIYKWIREINTRKH